MLFFELKRLFNFGSDFKLILNLFIGDFIDLRLFKIIPYILSGGKLSTNFYLLLYLRNFSEHSNKVLVIISSTKAFFNENFYLVLPIDLLIVKLLFFDY